MKDINKGAPLPPVQALITRAAQTSCSPLGPRLPDLSSQKISKQIQRKGGGVGRVNINIKAKNRKQSVARGPGPSSAPPPRRAPSPAHLPRRQGRRLPPFPLAPFSLPPPGAAARGSPARSRRHLPPRGARPAGRRYRARPSAPGSREALGPARPMRRRSSLSLPRKAVASRPGELQPRRGGRSRGWGADGEGAAAIPPTHPRRGPRRPRHSSPVGGAFLAGAVIVAQIEAVALGHGDGGRSVGRSGWLSVGPFECGGRAGALRSLPERRRGEARPTKWRPEGSGGSARGAGARARWPKPPLGARPTAPPLGALPRRREGSGLRRCRENFVRGSVGHRVTEDRKDPSDHPVQASTQHYRCNH